MWGVVRWGGMVSKKAPDLRIRSDKSGPLFLALMEYGVPAGLTGSRNPWERKITSQRFT